MGAMLVCPLSGSAQNGCGVAIDLRPLAEMDPEYRRANILTRSPVLRFVSLPWPSAHDENGLRAPVISADHEHRCSRERYVLYLKRERISSGGTGGVPGGTRREIGLSGWDWVVPVRSLRTTVPPGTLPGTPPA